MTHRTATEPVPDASPQQTDAGALLSDLQIRWLRRAVMVMTALLVAGVALLIGRVIYLARQGGTQAASAAATSVEPATLLAQARLVVPTGAEIKSISLSGAHLAVQHQGPGVELGIVVLDLSTGQIISRISIDRGK